MQKHNLNIVHDGVQYAGFAFTDLPLPAAIAVACQQIDAAADAARLSVVVDPLRALEYDRAASEAELYKNTGYQGDIPPTVASWAEAKGISGQEATDSILAEASAWNAALYAIRDARLKGKETVKVEASHDQVEAAADAAITAIRQTVAGVGNA